MHSQPLLDSITKYCLTSFSYSYFLLRTGLFLCSLNVEVSATFLWIFKKRSPIENHVFWWVPSLVTIYILLILRFVFSPVLSLELHRMKSNGNVALNWNVMGNTKFVCDQTSGYVSFFFRPTFFFFICFSWISLPKMANHKTATTTTSTIITAAKIDNGKCFPYYWILGSQRCGWQYGQGYMKGSCHNVGWCLLILLYNIK